MPFIVVFNIIVCVLLGGVLLTILGCSVATKDNIKRKGEKSESVQYKINKIRNITYLVFGCVMVLMLIVNLIF